MTGLLDAVAFGDKGQEIVVLHGGPGAAGSADPLAKGLSDEFSVVAPRQRRSGDQPLSVSSHIEDLKTFIDQKYSSQPALIGESWGAMLALAFASRYPASVSCVALIGCGTFSEAARQRLVENRKQRIDKFLYAHPEYIGDLNLPFGQQVMKWHSIVDNYCIDDVDQIPRESVLFDEFDKKGFEETWSDMLRCQHDGLYPQQFKSILCPVLMIHGSYDPHPGKVTYEELKKYIPHLEYRELEKCGHTPWKERFCKEVFIIILKQWLRKKNNMLYTIFLKKEST
jgi:pimeloyl-ACP methyl ester carboxylesterase